MESERDSTKYDPSEGKTHLVPVIWPWSSSSSTRFCHSEATPNTLIHIYTHTHTINPKHMWADARNHDSGHTRISTNLHINTLNPTNLIPTHKHTLRVTRSRSRSSWTFWDLPWPGLCVVKLRHSNRMNVLSSFTLSHPDPESDQTLRDRLTHAHTHQRNTQETADKNNVFLALGREK